MAKFKIEDMSSLINGTLYEAAEQAADSQKCIVLAIQDLEKSIVYELRCIRDVLKQIDLNTSCGSFSFGSVDLDDEETPFSCVMKKALDEAKIPYERVKIDIEENEK